jgi:mono/diheme cytochrome c family protein
MEGFAELPPVMLAGSDGGDTCPHCEISSSPPALWSLACSYKLDGNDLTLEQCDALVAFVASLPAPQQILPADSEQANLVRNGEKIFETIGCAGCHVRDVENARGIYSDLLLHDMGPALEDPNPAFPERLKVGTRSVGNVGYGGPISIEVIETIPSPVRREWKTASLWGVRDSAPYLHDGRASTLVDAIAAHGGEAASSAGRFGELDDVGRTNVLLFLNSLAAPAMMR